MSPATVFLLHRHILSSITHKKIQTKNKIANGAKARRKHQPSCGKTYLISWNLFDVVHSSRPRKYKPSKHKAYVSLVKLLFQSP